MSLIRLCREDPLVSLVYELFGANIVRVPDARVRPLTVVVHRDGRSFFRGALLPLLTDSRPLASHPRRPNSPTSRGVARAAWPSI